MNNNKILAFGIGLVITLLIGIMLYAKLIGKNDFQDFQIVQSLNGHVEIQTKPGLYYLGFADVWTYPKADSIFFSNEMAESVDNDAIKVIFSNKSTGDVNCNVVVKYFTDDKSMMSLHEYFGGDLDKIDNFTLSRLKEHITNEAAKKDPSTAVEQKEEFAAAIRQRLQEDIDLKEHGISIETFSITSIDPDEKTNQLFDAQRTADLQKKSAEAEEANLVMQKKKTEAVAAQNIAEAKGKAEVEKMTATTAADKEAQLATIKAQQEVDVAELDKKKAEIEAQQKLQIIEIQRQEEEKKLEVVQLQVKQKIAEAEAKQKEIELSGAITETEKFKLETEKNTKIGVAEAIAKGINGLKLPEVLFYNTGANGGGATGSAMPSELSTLFNLLNAQKATEVAHPANSAK